MQMNYAVADVRQVDTLDAYHKYRGANMCYQRLEVFSGFHFYFKKCLQIIEGKYSNHIFNESIDTDTHACGICWLEWRQAEEVMNFTDEYINVNSMIIVEF